MRKTLTTLLLMSLFGSVALHAQTNCFFQGFDQNWDSRFLRPGVSSASVNQLVVSQDGSLIICSGSSAAFGGDISMSGIARWDGEKYSPIGDGMYGISLVPMVNAAVEDANGNLYVGGNFTGARNADGTQVASRNIIRFNITTQSWEPIGTGLQGGTVSALAIDNDTLYVGGSFTQSQDINPIPLNKIARYYLTSGAWDSLGTGVGNMNASFLNGNVEVLEMAANGQLLVGGGISSADNITVNSIARWTPGQGWDDLGGGLT
ncbi:MAG: hypothetical protein AAFP02_10930, partial [Bacteroidota bacterium]